MKENNEENRKTLFEERETYIELETLDNQNKTSLSKEKEKEISRNSQILGDNKENEKHKSLFIDE